MRLRVFTAISSRDRNHRDSLVERARLEKLPFDFVDMSGHKSLDEVWRASCGTYIHGSDGVIALISEHTAEDPEQLWAIRCAYAEKKPIMLMYASQDEPALPEALLGKHVNASNWANLKTFMESLWLAASRSR